MLPNWECGLSMDAAYTWTFTVLNLLVEKVRVLCLFFSSPVLQALKDQIIKECVVGPRHVAFLLEVSH